MEFNIERNSNGTFKKGCISFNKGKKMSLETKKRLSLSKKGKKAWNLGCPCSEETKNKIRIALKGKSWGKHTNKTRKKISAALFLRHKYENLKNENSYRFRARKFYLHNNRYRRCRICHKIGKVDVHHIDENVKNNDIKNLISLCRSCHRKIHYKKERLRNDKGIFIKESQKCQLITDKKVDNLKNCQK